MAIYTISKNRKREEKKNSVATAANYRFPFIWSENIEMIRFEIGSALLQSKWTENARTREGEQKKNVLFFEIYFWLVALVTVDLEGQSHWHHQPEELNH